MLLNLCQGRRNCKDAIMKKTNSYTNEQKLLLLLNKFIIQLDESGYKKDNVVKNAYLFCVGFFIKYSEAEYTPLLYGSNNILAMLTNALVNPDTQSYRNTQKISRVLYFYKFIVEYIAWNPVEAEKTFDDEKLKYEKFVIAQQIKMSIEKPKSRGGM